MTQPSVEQAVMNAALNGIPISNPLLVGVHCQIVGKALEELAHTIDWEIGDPKFLVLDIANKLKQSSVSLKTAEPEVDSLLFC